MHQTLQSSSSSFSPNVADITVTASRGRRRWDRRAEPHQHLHRQWPSTSIKPRARDLANSTGGLSGPAVRPLAVYLVHRVYRAVARDAKVPIIGMGGIQYWQDAAEFLLAGASGLAVGTALFVDPATPLKIAEGFQGYLAQHKFNSINDVIGTLELHGETPKTPYP